MKVELSRDWDGAAYSPTHQRSFYPMPAATHNSIASSGDRTIVASSITNDTGSDCYLQIRNGEIDGDIALSLHLPSGFTTLFQFPVKTEDRPFVAFTTSAFDNTLISSPDLIGATFWTR